MRRWKWAALGLAAFVILAIVLPPAELRLLQQPSCFAFAGAIPESRRSQGSGADESPLDVERDYAVTRRGRPLQPPYIIVTRQLEDAVVDASIATRSAGGWQVEQFLTSSGEALPPRRLDGDAAGALEALLAKKCLFKEPANVAIVPRVWLSWPPPIFSDGVAQRIEVHDGARSHTVTQMSQAGVTGALGALVVKDGRGLDGRDNASAR